MFTKLAVSSVLLASGANAFVVKAPTTVTGVTARSNDMSMMAEKSKSVPFLDRPENLKGMVGDVQFDPLGFSDYIPVDFLREAELKHGRICMLATLGWIAADFVKLPGDVHQVSSLAAHDAAVSSGAMTQMLIWISVFEAISIVSIKQMLDGSGRKPGDFGFDPLNFKGANDEAMQLKEIKNGRLAMLAFSGIVTQAAAFGHGFPYQ